MLGSDGSFVLFGNSMNSYISDASRRANTLMSAGLGHEIIGFKLFAGRTFCDCRPLGRGELIEVTPEPESIRRGRELATS